MFVTFSLESSKKFNFEAPIISIELYFISFISFSVNYDHTNINVILNLNLACELVGIDTYLIHNRSLIHKNDLFNCFSILKYLNSKIRHNKDLQYCF